ncbi:hypothetical protein A8C32_06355 [Flavivirga aquatica]|uniref:Uncharacterized protein n=1 Tax=Flavivirga aquatica TaxID=1849968 RepID=A0A1E5SI68_9FLAO|nr:hypothetical protein [Flavivirga aquatica]OEJ98808.1 hypothetical protein A8C32_06355 [Flavivirga aquatica]
MKLKKVSISILCLTVGFLSCKKDDDGIQAPQNINISEQQIKDNDSIVNYLETHYYNSSTIESDPKIKNLVITKIEKGAPVPTGNTLLNDKVESKTLTIGDVTFEYYILKLNQGGGVNSPAFSDNVLIAYEGIELDEDIFDSALHPNPSIIDLTNTIRGWKLVIPEFNAAADQVDQGDGTTVYNNAGVGMMFLPTGLAYLFNPENRLQLSPLIFKFELLKCFENDHDNDGIPSYLEDITEDGLFTVTTEASGVKDDDTDGNNIPNYVDNDDDGDGILTKDEITITVTEKKATVEELKMMTLESNQVLLNKINEEEDGTFTGTIITFTDTDADGKADYLDAE